MRVNTSRFAFLAISLQALALSAHAENTVNEDLVAQMETYDGATTYIEHFLAGVNPEETLVQNSAFIERTNQNDDHFLLAKVLVSYTTPNGATRQIVRGVVCDLATDWTTIMSEENYNSFLRTGDRSILNEPNLNPEPLVQKQVVQRLGTGNERLLTAQDVVGLNVDQIRHAINTIYARYGATFPQAPDVQRQFNRVSWYHPNPRLTFEDIDQMMSSTEAQNVKLLAWYCEGLRNR